MRHRRQTFLLPLLGILAGPVPADESGRQALNPAELEAQGVLIGEITLKKDNVFDLSDPKEDVGLFRLANRLHINTRDETISKQLLFAQGQEYSARLLAESERILRQNKYLYDADIVATRLENGVVDLAVTTRDVWSIAPEISLSRSGGETRSRYGLEESNLLGRGQKLRFLHREDVDRTENTIEFSDRHLGRSWVSASFRYSDNSDGDSHLVAIARPFYALDTRWAAGGSIYGDDRRDTLYVLAEEAAEYRHERDYFSAYGGWSGGLKNGRVRRWTAGIIKDANRFSAVPDASLPPLLPDNRELVYPFIGFELVEDGYVTASNHDQMSRTEDFQMGLRAAASLGWSDASFGADRDALMFTASSSHGFGSLEGTALLLAANASGRVESGHASNTLVSLSARYYHRQTSKRLFYAAMSGTAGHSLDLDSLVQLGGDTGLRGYPLRYQVGESRLLATIEQRYYTDWYPFRLARVGAAIFADVGRVWGPNPLGPDNRGWASDVGFGLRLALTRVNNRVIHIDVAFPLNGDPTIDEIQFLLETRSSF